MLKVLFVILLFDPFYKHHFPLLQKSLTTHSPNTQEQIFPYPYFKKDPIKPGFHSDCYFINSMTNTLRKLIAIIALVLVAAAQSSGVSSASSAQSSSGIWSSSITGSWKMISAAGYSTNISVSVSATTIRFSYCNQQSYNYRIGWGNSISINLGSTT